MPNFLLENKSYRDNLIMIGVDEAGRGSWAGPLVASACWIDYRRHHLLSRNIKDSKKLNSLRRREIMNSIFNFAKYSISISSEREIDRYGLSFANTMAMKRSIFSLVESLKVLSKNNLKNFRVYVDGKYKPDFYKVDKFLKKGNLKLEQLDITPIVKGDQISKTVALASIFAKETRDIIMKQYSILYPLYSFDTHCGYGTKKHISEIHKYGILNIHRKSFKPISTICS